MALDTIQNVVFEKAPVAEVVCGVRFSPLSSMHTGHLGMIWSEFREQFPKYEEKEVILPSVEKFGDDRFGNSPAGDIRLDGLPRVWLTNDDDSGVLQIQRDFFLFNWKKSDVSKIRYPRFTWVYEQFEQHFGQFKALVDKNSMGEIFHTQYELTYVNLIDSGLGWTGDVRSLMPRIVLSSAGGFLPQPSGFDWKTTFDLPDQWGRLRLRVVKLVHRDGSDMLRLDMVTRGIPPDGTSTGMRSWFNVAHEWALRGFCDAIASDVQQECWGKR